MASATFTVNGSAVTGAVSVSAGSTVTLALTDTTGLLGNPEWSIAGTSASTLDAPTITTAGTPSGVTASFTVENQSNQGFLVQCVVNNGRNALGYFDENLTFRAVVGVVNSQGLIPIPIGEEFERNATHGIVNDFNTVMGVGGGVNITDDAGHGDRGGGTLHADVTTSSDGFMTAADKRRLDAVNLAFVQISDMVGADDDARFAAAQAIVEAAGGGTILVDEDITLADEYSFSTAAVRIECAPGVVVTQDASAHGLSLFQFRVARCEAKGRFVCAATRSIITGSVYESRAPRERACAFRVQADACELDVDVYNFDNAVVVPNDGANPTTTWVDDVRVKLRCDHCDQGVLAYGVRNATFFATSSDTTDVQAVGPHAVYISNSLGASNHSCTVETNDDGNDYAGSVKVRGLVDGFVRMVSLASGRGADIDTCTRVAVEVVVTIVEDIAVSADTNQAGITFIDCVDCCSTPGTIIRIADDVDEPMGIRVRGTSRNIVINGGLLCDNRTAASFRSLILVGDSATCTILSPTFRRDGVENAAAVRLSGGACRVVNPVLESGQIVLQVDGAAYGSRALLSKHLVTDGWLANSVVLNVSAWADSTLYDAGDFVEDGGKWYQTAAGGTSSGTGVADDSGVTDWSEVEYPTISVDGVVEGEFLPTVTFSTPGDLSVSYATQWGHYWKTGGLVRFELVLDFTPTFTTGTGTLYIGGLPFTSQAESEPNAYGCCTIPDMDNVVFSSGSLEAIVERQQARCRFRRIQSGNTSADLAQTAIPTGGTYRICISGYYPTEE